MMILVVDDDPGIRQLLQVTFQIENFEVILAEDGQEALDAVEKEKPDLVVLDLMLPIIDGWQVCKQLRVIYDDLPIIMLTAKGEETDTIIGLKLGADDYVSKPFSPKELVARVEAVLRRANRNGTHGKDFLVFPGLMIDQKKRVVKINDEEIEISPKEFDILWELARRPGQVYKREVLLDRVWGYDYIGTTRTVDVHIKRLRAKLEEKQMKYTYVQTVWGVGYKFEVIE